MTSRATDHGGNRESEQLLRGGADRGVPCHRSWKKSLKSVEVPQLQSSTEFGDEMKAVGQFLTHFASFFALLRLSRS